jgi:hypothetical protein
MDLLRLEPSFRAIARALRRAAPIALPVLVAGLSFSFHGVDIFSSWTI